MDFVPLVNAALCLLALGASLYAMVQARWAREDCEFAHDRLDNVMQDEAINHPADPFGKDGLQ